MIDIVAICGGSDPSNKRAFAAAMLSRSPMRYDDAVATWHSDDGLVTVAGARVSGVGRVSESAGMSLAVGATATVVADSRLTYRGDLLDRLPTAFPGHGGNQPTDAQLILAAYEHFGRTALDFLEGEFAFVIWDRAQRTLVAARDFLGRYRLLYAFIGDDLVIASSIPHLRAHPAANFPVNRRTLGKVVSLMWGHGNETAFDGLLDLPAGEFISWTPGGRVQPQQFFKPPATFDKSPPTGEAAHILRGLLMDSLRENLASDSPTAVSLSGGWDSSAVFAAGQEFLRTSAREPSLLLPVSMSYPPGDSGREDETIAQTCAHWKVKPNWIDIASAPLLANLEERSRSSADPALHLFGVVNTALFRRAKQVGASRILDGFGGDMLFQVSKVYLADVLREGRPLEMIRQWRSRGGTRLRSLLKLAVVPNLSSRSLDLVAALRGGQRPAFWLDRKPAPWLARPFLRENSLEEHDRTQMIAFPSSSATLVEMHALIRFPFFARINALLRRSAAEEGVETGAPLSDCRVVRFAGSRPWYERANRNETKILLRRSMRGLLPDSVLAPRDKHTGTLHSYMRSAVSSGLKPFVDAIARESVLADMGIVVPAALAWCMDRYLEDEDSRWGEQLLATVQTELWLRGQTGAPRLLP